MTRDEWTRAAWQGWRLGCAGLGASELRDVMEIGRLNRRAVAAWERENACGGDYPDGAERADRQNQAAHRAAHELATARGWAIDCSGGLWWSLSVPGFLDGNALSGLR